MADPVTLTGISLGATALGGLTSAFGAASGGAAQGAMYKYQSGIAQMNKRINLENADYSRYVGEVEAQTSGLKTAQTVGAIKTKQAASGVDITSGSAAKVQESQEAVGQHDQAIIRANAARRAYGFETKAAGEEAQAQMYEMAGSQSKKAGIISALGSLIGTAGSVSSKWLQAKNVGIFDSGEGYYGGSPSSNSKLVPV